MAVPGDDRARRCSGMPERRQSSIRPGRPVSPKRNELRASMCQRPERVWGAARKTTRPYEKYERSRARRTPTGPGSSPGRFRPGPGFCRNASCGIRGERPRGNGTRSFAARASRRGRRKSSPYSVTRRSGSAARKSRRNSVRNRSPSSQSSSWVRPSAENRSDRVRPCAGCPVPSPRRNARESGGSARSTSHGESRTRAERIVPSPAHSASAAENGKSPVAQANCCSGAMSAL